MSACLAWTGYFSNISKLSSSFNKFAITWIYALLDVSITELVGAREGFYLCLSKPTSITASLSLLPPHIRLNILALLAIPYGLRLVCHGSESSKGCKMPNGRVPEKISKILCFLSAAPSHYLRCGEPLGANAPHVFT